jgi:hypothetical protein
MELNKNITGKVIKDKLMEEQRIKAEDIKIK